MADLATLNALANEARRQELRQKVSRLQGEMDGHSIAMQALSRANSDALRTLQSAQQELVALEQGAGPGITDQFGMRSSVDNFCTEERTAGQGASIDYIKANPSCTQAEAVAAWDAGVTAWLPQGTVATHKADGLLALYTADLFNASKILDSSWEAFAAFIVTTDKTVLLSM